MTPKEKAQELWNDATNAVFPIINKEFVRKVALAIVDQVIMRTPVWAAVPLTKETVWYDSDYWQKVKEELQKM